MFNPLFDTDLTLFIVPFNFMNTMRRNQSNPITWKTLDSSFSSLWCTSGISSWTNILFILYTQPLSNVIQQYPVFHQMYADDTQIYKSCRPSEIVDIINSIEHCISNVKTWMLHNKLQMNDDKTLIQNML